MTKLNKSNLKLEWEGITLVIDAEGKDAVVDTLMLIGHLLDYMRVLGYGRPRATAKGAMKKLA